ncbi:MAG: hypothetical protein ACTSRP_13055 [Candidatus Helarchaeota archaeon]
MNKKNLFNLIALTNKPLSNKSDLNNFFFHIFLGFHFVSMFPEGIKFEVYKKVRRTTEGSVKKIKYIV